MARCGFVGNLWWISLRQTGKKAARDRRECVRTTSLPRTARGANREPGRDTVQETAAENTRTCRVTVDLPAAYPPKTTHDENNRAAARSRTIAASIARPVCLGVFPEHISRRKPHDLCLFFYSGITFDRGSLFGRLSGLRAHRPH